MVSLIPEGLEFTKEHEWIERTSDGVIRFGITDYAQSALGDIVYIQLPSPGDILVAGKVCGEVESTKSVSEIFAPVSGKVLRVNDSLNQSPETMNKEPYGSGWIAEVESTAVGELLSPAEYRNLVGE
jgi:glycine cleavage system H protein